MADPVDVSLPKTAPREAEADFQIQVDNLRQALQDWRRTRDYSQSMEQRLAQITVQCARMVDSWQQMERSRVSTVRGGDSRLPEPVGERIMALERAVEDEWNSLPEAPDPSAKHLSEQAASLAESCVTAANLTLRGVASVESRLAALEQDFEVRMTQLSRDLQTVVAELRNARPQPLPGPAPAFPLESVMRIHQELRESDAGASPGADALTAAAPKALPAPSESTAALAARVESLERAVETTAGEVQGRRGVRPLHVAAGLIVLFAAAAVFGVWMQRRVDARLDDADQRVSAAERQRDSDTAAARQQAAREVADARQSAVRAQVVGNVLAAPDLVRYWLIGPGESARPYAQLLISRSRGMVFSASRLPAAGAGRAYQLWILTRGGPVSGGVFAPDSSGRVTVTTDVPPTLPGRMTGAVVTLEAEGGGTTPSSEAFLTKVE